MICCLDSVFRKIYTFSLGFFTGTIESSSKLLKESSVKNLL